MADHVNDEEDLFADLYEGDDSAPAPAPAPEAPYIPEPSPVPQPAEPSEAIANGSNGAVYDNGDADDNAVYNDGGAYNQGYEANEMQDVQGWQNQSHDQSQMRQEQDHSQDYDRPIGSKEDGKMFIGGLNWETTDQSLKDYFSQFGEVIECTVMRDGASGRSRGFGFLTFRDPKCVNTVVVKEHQLDGKIIDPKRAIPRDEQERTSKIFVGGVSQEASEQDFKSFFMQFGRVLDATLMMDKDTGRPRGFGFVTFDSEAAVDRTLQGPLEILGKPIEVKKAQPRGNLRDDNDDGGRGRFRQNKNDKFSRDDRQGGYDNQQNQMPGGLGGANNNNMSPAMMAQYWSRMQQYFQMMRQQMAQNMGQGPGMNPMAAMGGQPNPQMMQQMMAMQQNGMGGGQGMPNGMNPAMMQQMAQMQQQQQLGGYSGVPQSGMMSPQSGMMSPGGGAMQANRPAYTAQEQMAFEQQKYERQQTQHMGGGGSQSGQGGQPQQQQQQPQQQQFGGGPTSWEGMYDDVPQPAGMGGPQGGGNMRGGFGGRGRGGMQNRGSQGPMSQPQGQAPVGAPTGPKNAGKPGSNYRGGGRGGGGHRGGFHPYARGGA